MYNDIAAWPVAIIGITKIALFGNEGKMMVHEEPHVAEKSEEQLDEEAEERFADESPAEEPVFGSPDPDDSPDQPNDEA